jgi:hypothetical protein
MAQIFKKPLFVFGNSIAENGKEFAHLRVINGAISTLHAKENNTHICSLFPIKKFKKTQAIKFSGLFSATFCNILEFFLHWRFFWGLF